MTEGLPKGADRRDATIYEKQSAPFGYDVLPPEAWLAEWHNDKVTESYWYAIDQFYAEKKIKLEGAEIILLYVQKTLAKMLRETDFGEKVINREYGSVLGEDASGRIPAIIVHECIKQLLRGKDDMPLRFYAGHREHGKSESTEEVWKEEASKYFNSLPPGKILIVTEAIGHGGTLINTLEALTRCGREADVIDAQTGLFPLDEDVARHATRPDNFKDTVERNYYISGVWKKNGDIHARSTRDAAFTSQDPEAMRYIQSDSAKRMRRENRIPGRAGQELSSEEREKTMQATRTLAKFIGANVAQAYLDWKAGKFKLRAKGGRPAIKRRTEWNQ